MEIPDTSKVICIFRLTAYANVREYYWFTPGTMHVLSLAGREPRQMKWLIDSDGYRYVGLRTRSNYQLTIRRSHLVLEAAGQRRPGPDYDADHTNNDHTDDRLENLRWIPRSENNPRSGLRRSISDAHTAMAREERRFNNTMFSNAEIAKYAGTTPRTVRKAATGKTHADVPVLPMPTGRQIRTMDPKTGEWEISEPTDAEWTEMIEHARKAKEHPELEEE